MSAKPISDSMETMPVDLGIEDIYPLSPMQQGLLFHSLYEIESDLYLIQLSCRLQGDLDVSAFADAWRHVLNSHPVMRTAFFWDEGSEPLQIVMRNADLPFKFLDWQGMDSGEQESLWKDLLTDDRRQAFNLERAPLTRITLIRRKDREYSFLWTHHHLVLDGWCLSLVLGDVFAAYKALSLGKVLPFFSRRPYRDYIAWLKSCDMDAAEQFWRKRLENFDGPTPLSIDHRQSGMPSVASEQSVKLSTDETSQLIDWVKQNKLTTSTVVQGAWALLLAHYSHERDVLFGITVSGRPVELSKAEEMIGLFINSLPLRVYVDPSSTVVDWLHSLLQENLQIRRYEYAPLVKIQDWSGVPHGQSLFNTLLSFENYPLDETITNGMDGLAVSDIHFMEKTNYPLTAIISPGECLEIKLLYDEAYYSASAIGLLGTHLKMLLQGMVNRPNVRLGELFLSTDEERNQQFEQWNATALTYPNHTGFLELFSRHVHQKPANVAVSCGEKQVDYNELNLRSNCLANYLKSRHVAPETRVAICLERSPELIVAILAVLKAGAAYVPIATDCPQQRLRELMSDCGALFLLTQKSIAERLDNGGSDLILIDRDWAEVASHDATDLTTPVLPDYAAYVIYTSGSTGQPKGVVVSHRNLLHSTLARFKQYPLPLEGFLLLSPASFDSSVAGIFWTLGQGGRLCLPTEEQSHDIWALGELIERYKLSHILCLPSFYNLLLEQLQPAQLATLNTVIVAGEVCSTALVEKHFKSFSHLTLHNEYGPTEGTVWCTVQHVDTKPETTSVPIGRPISNVQTYVLDIFGNQAPVGIAGELYIAGSGLARGYLNRPDLTAERFLPNPFTAGECLYRTGDLVRYTENGTLEFLGRIDNQVKIRGFRIELEEIEACLVSWTSVKDAAVAVHRDIAGNDRIVAYLVWNSAADIDIEALRAMLNQKLPAYMVPALFITLETMPLNSNGKLDRKQLPLPDLEQRSGNSCIAPCTQLEESLVRIWSEVLQLERISIDDSFFALGGDSIQAIQVTGRARQYGIAITPKQLFEQQTISNLARVAGKAVQRNEDQGLISGNVSLTPIQSWFFERNLVNPHHWNQSLLFEAKVEVVPEFLQRAITSLLNHHDALRLRFAFEEGRWTQFHVENFNHPVLQIENLADVADDDLSGILAARSAYWQSQLNITNGPVFLAVLFDCGRKRNTRLLLVIHHLVVDGVSWRVLVEDLQAAYKQAPTKQSIELPAKSASFKRWSENLNEYAGSDRLKQDIDYWSGQVWQRAMPMPVDIADGFNFEKDAETVTTRLSLDETGLLYASAAQFYAVEVKEILLASLAGVLAAWTGSDTVVVEQEGHGREGLFDGLDLSRTVGWFTCSFPVVLNLSAGVEPREMLQEVVQQLRRIPKNGLPYGVACYLAETLNLTNQPKARVIFNFLGQINDTTEKSPLFVLAPEAVGNVYDANAPRVAELEISAQVRDGQLELAWTYSGARYYQSTIRTLLDRQVEAIRQVIRQYESSGAVFLKNRRNFIPGEMPDWGADINLEPGIAPIKAFEVASYKRSTCFLTGTTGFVGTFLLDELLRKTDATVYCLVRAASYEDAIGKIQAQRGKYRLLQPLALNRIVPVCGDLAEPLFGLTVSGFADLAERIDTIYHVGAATNLLQPYALLKAANVSGTVEVLRLACTGKVKAVHYTSTLSVFNHHSEVGPGEITELNTPGLDPALDMGYAQSKVVAETLLRQAAHRGCPVVVYRLGTVTGHSLSGAWNKDDFYSRLLRTCIGMGLVPEPDDLIDMTPVDYICESIIRLSGNVDSFGRTFHLQNPNPIDINQLLYLLDCLGRPVKQAPYDVWVNRLVQSNGFSEGHVLYPFMSYFLENAKPSKLDQKNENYTLRFTCRDTVDYLKHYGIACPLIDERLLRTYLEYLGCMAFPMAEKRIGVS